METTYYPQETRELIHASPMPDGGTSCFYRTSFGFETDILSPDGFLVSRGSLAPDLTPLQSTSQPSLVHWNKSGQVTFMSFNPSAKQIERYFRNTPAPLTTGYVLVAGQLRPTSYFAPNPETGLVDQTFVSYWDTGMIATVNTYCPGGEVWLTRYGEDGTPLGQHFLKDGVEVPLPENPGAPHIGSVSNS